MFSKVLPVTYYKLTDKSFMVDNIVTQVGQPTEIAGFTEHWATTGMIMTKYVKFYSPCAQLGRRRVR